jgi:SAM-dependent methyltransferase
MEDDLVYDLGAAEIAGTMARAKNMLAKVFRLIPDGSRVLDVGCHTGKFGAFLRQNGCLVSGVEINSSAASVAEELLDEVAVGDVEDSKTWQRLGGPFDVILFLDVLEHCRKPEAVLIDARTKLSAHGFVIASIPNIAHWTMRKNLLWGCFDYQDTGILDKTHLRFFTVSSCQKLLIDAGYDIELVDYVLTMPKLLKQRVIPTAVARKLPGLFAYQVVIKAKLSTMVP